MTLSSLLHLGDLLRLILLQPQSAKIQDFTKSQISLKKFSIPECLLGLVTAEDLNLTSTADHLLQFINNNPGKLCLQESRDSRHFILIVSDAATELERLNLIYNGIKRRGEEFQKKILKSLDTSSYSKKELLDLVRSKIEKVEKSYISGITLFLYKDEINIGKVQTGEVFFFPQHLSKLE